jgi:hypothetical protein
LVKDHLPPGIDRKDKIMKRIKTSHAGIADTLDALKRREQAFRAATEEPEDDINTADDRAAWAEEADVAGRKHAALSRLAAAALLAPSAARTPAGPETAARRHDTGGAA